MEKNNDVQTKTQRKTRKCPLCSQSVFSTMLVHVREAHSEEEWHEAILKAKEEGMSDPEIGERFGVSYGLLQQIITKAYGANISVLRRPKKIKRWEPKSFHEETSTVWSYRRRGDWATHNGRYRGNWSPYIPRNVILKYSNPGDVVLDYFIGGGTTAVEAKLLGRRCIARDINPGSIGLTKENLNFSIPRRLFDDEVYEPDVSVGDARALTNIPDESIDLIATHPPYAGIIKYSSQVEGDLSDFTVSEFLEEMEKVANESMRVLKPGGKCVFLIGDGRKAKHVVPIGFQTIKVFRDAGFILKELVIKRQHNCKTTGFWYQRSIDLNFLLLAHEYLPIFEKPKKQKLRTKKKPKSIEPLSYGAAVEKVSSVSKNEMETTTVWIFPNDQLEQGIERNLLKRFAKPSSNFITITLNRKQKRKLQKLLPESSLVYLQPPKDLTEKVQVEEYIAKISSIVDEIKEGLESGSFLVIDAYDVKIRNALHALGLRLWEKMVEHKEMAIKEIVVVVPENPSEVSETHEDTLQIIHRYLLVYVKNWD